MNPPGDRRKDYPCLGRSYGVPASVTLRIGREQGVKVIGRCT
jgi:hypothetical protein